MQFPFPIINDLDDVTRNFEAIQDVFGFPVLAAAPPNPAPGQAYVDSTLAKLGFYVNGAWTYVP